jgi:hypothetical protein
MKRRSFMKQTLKWAGGLALLTRLPVEPRVATFPDRAIVPKRIAGFGTLANKAEGTPIITSYPSNKMYEYRWVPDSRKWRMIAKRDGYTRAANLEPRDGMVAIRRPAG